MKTTEVNPRPEPKQVSEAKRKANRLNAQFSTGPRDTRRTRFNACQHGLRASLFLPGQDTERDRRFLQEAWARLGPRNAIEEGCVQNFLRTRLREDSCLEIERVVLTRRPVGIHPDVEQPYPFLLDPTALKALAALCRRLAHLTRAAEKDLLTLLQVRQESRGPTRAATAPAAPPTGPGAADAESVGAAPYQRPPDAELPGLSPASLEDCLADQRLILPGEDPQAYEALAREVWAAFAPANLLEAFITTDYLQTQWRLNRVPRIEQALFERLAVSTTGDHCGIGFAFIHDSQRHQVLETLGHYEAILRKRLEKRLALFRRLRQEGWNEAVCPRPEPGAQSQPIPPVGDAFVSSSTPTLPTPGPTPEPAPVAPIVEAQLEPTQPALGPIASAGSVADSRPAAAPHDSTAGPVNPPAS